ncbi:MAG: MazG family protein [Brevinematales bacterium]|nr:MazG family protein [Brevinematales bacterium]
MAKSPKGWEVMQAFDELLQLIEILRSPAGCPWDREQTLASMRSALIEEVYEVVEAIDTSNKDNFIEEIGDLLFVTCFVAYLAQQEGMTTLEDILLRVKHKLIRRHPHVFGERKDLNVESILSNWERIKESEKVTLSHPLKSIPKSLPELQRLYKILSKMKRLKFSWQLEPLQKVAREIEPVATRDPTTFFKGVLLYAFEKGVDLSAVIRELSSELIEYYDKQNPSSEKR